jgi:hypothetical protein
VEGELSGNYFRLVDAWSKPWFRILQLVCLELRFKTPALLLEFAGGFRQAPNLFVFLVAGASFAAIHNILQTLLKRSWVLPRNYRKPFRKVNSAVERYETPSRESPSWTLF